MAASVFLHQGQFHLNFFHFLHPHGVKLKKMNCWEIPGFRADRATIHLFQKVEDDNNAEFDADAMTAYMNGVCNVFEMSQTDMNTLKPYLRRGDILENVQTSGYRSTGWYMFDGEQVRELAGDLDEYGGISKDYLVYSEFNPYYWQRDQMNENNILVPGEKARGYWHGDTHPCYYIDGEAVLGNVNGKITFQGVEYTLPKTLIETVTENPYVKKGFHGFPCADVSQDEFFYGCVGYSNIAVLK